MSFDSVSQAGTTQTDMYVHVDLHVSQKQSSHSFQRSHLGRVMRWLPTYPRKRRVKPQIHCLIWLEVYMWTCWSVQIALTQLPHPRLGDEPVTMLVLTGSVAQALVAQALYKELSSISLEGADWGWKAWRCAQCSSSTDALKHAYCFSLYKGVLSGCRLTYCLSLLQ